MSTSKPIKSATIHLRALRPLRLEEISSPAPDMLSCLNGRNDIEYSLYLEFCSFRTTAQYLKYCTSWKLIMSRNIQLGVPIEVGLLRATALGFSPADPCILPRKVISY